MSKEKIIDDLERGHIDYVPTSPYTGATYDAVLKGEQYWKTIFKGVKEGAKTKTSHIILFLIGGSS